MPFSRPPLTELQTQAAQDIAANLPGTDPLLRFSNLGSIGVVLAGMTYLLYGYLDYIAQQSNPFTATDEFLEAWAALKGIFRLAAAQASGTVTFTGTGTPTIPSGTPLVRGDGYQYVTTADGTIASGTVTVPATAVADPAGLIGANGNAAVGTLLNLGTAIAGVNSTGIVATAFTGGADLELDDNLRSRMLIAYQNPAHGGDVGDYEGWALEVAGVTRVWVIPHGFGAGTVIVYVMLDSAEAIHGGIPQGSNGVAAGESRAAAATGDQLAVANFIFPLQPVTALVFVVAPTLVPVNFTISGISAASTATKNAVKAALAAVFLREQAANGSTIQLGDEEAAIAAVPGTTGFVITSPVANQVGTVGQLLTLGTTTFT